MWIKNLYGDYVNMDRASYVYTNYDGCTCVSVDDCEYEIAKGDIREDVIATIISGAKVMEVR